MIRLRTKKTDAEPLANDPFIIRQGRIRQGRINASYRLGWTEDSFIMDTGGKETLGRTFNSDKSKYLIFGLLFFLSFLLSRSAWLQVVKGDYYYKMAEGNRIRVERLEPRRGVIYDRHLDPLVRNQANFLMYVVPADLPKDEGKLKEIEMRISEILAPMNSNRIFTTDNESDRNLTATELFDAIHGRLERIKRGSLESLRPVFITDKIPYEKALLLQLESSNWQGVVVSSKVSRDYNLEAQSLSHILGYTGKISQKELDKYGDEYLQIDYIGKSGLESFWENELRGTNGKKQIEVDALGREKKIISIQESQDGHDLVLALDMELQRKIEQVTRAALDKAKLKRAAVVAIDPRNGEILSLVNLPAYDDNLFAHGIGYEDYQRLLNDPDRPLFNRAVSGEFPSGSTIKPVMAIAALEEGIITENTAFLSSGGLRISQWYFPDWKAGGHGMTDVRKAIAESVNTFFYIVGGGYQDTRGLGVDRITRYDRLFGLGSQTGIDLPGEASGFVPSKQWKEETKNENWYIGDTYHLAIGQGDLNVTPLQVAAYTAAFANSGKLMQPHLVKTIITSKTGEKREVAPNPVRQDFVNPYNMKIVREGMRQTVLAGSARSLQTVPVAVAGKTGTAQWSSKKDPHAWFTGFAPYDEPTIALTILVEEGKEGSAIAVPIAREVLSWYFSPHPAKGATSTAITASSTRP